MKTILFVHRSLCSTRASTHLSLLSTLLISGCGSDPSSPTASDATTGAAVASSGVVVTGVGPGTGTGTGIGTTTVDPGSGSESTTDDPGGATTQASSSGQDTDSPPLTEFDCAQAPDGFLSDVLVIGPLGRHGLAITPDGRMIGSDASSLLASVYGGPSQVFSPGTGYGDQMDWLPDGDLVWASSNENSILRVSPLGATFVIRPGAFYPIVVGGDGMIYTSRFPQGVSRVDPDTGVLSVLFDPPQNAATIRLSGDGSKLYLAKSDQNPPSVEYTNLDADMNPVGELHVISNDAIGPDIASGPPNTTYDALEVDACGTLYVSDYDSGAIYRIKADGATDLYWGGMSAQFHAHAMTWGSGEHGWRSDALYIAQPYNGNVVREIIVGVPSRDFAGTVTNVTPLVR